MACGTITDIVVRETGRYLADEIFSRVFANALWPTIFPRGEFPKGLGETISVLTYERSAPATPDSGWSDVAVADGSEGGACLQPAIPMLVGSTSRNFNLKRKILEGPDFCAEEMRSPFEVMQQLERITDALAGQIKLEWDDRDKHEYFRMCKYKVVVDGCPPTEDTTQAATYPVATPTSIMTNGILNRYYLRLTRDGALGMGRDNGKPILTWICSSEASDDLIFRNAEIRQDLRWAEPNQLLKRLGVTRNYRNFFHLLDEYPRRFTFPGGVATEVAPFTTTAASKGWKADVNSSWTSASYEESFIFEPTVCRQLVPKPITNPAPGYRFDPVNYMGQLKIMNIPDRKCNPDGSILYHRAILAAGTMPEHPERGVAFVHLVCGDQCSLVTSCGS